MTTELALTAVDECELMAVEGGSAQAAYDTMVQLGKLFFGGAKPAQPRPTNTVVQQNSGGNNVQNNYFGCPQ